MCLLWSHGFSMCSLQISVLFVLMRVEISLFSSEMLGYCGVFLLVQFMCLILLRMSCGRSLSVLRIPPTVAHQPRAGYHHYTTVFYCSTHRFVVSLNIRRSSKFAYPVLSLFRHRHVVHGLSDPILSVRLTAPV